MVNYKSYIKISDRKRHVLLVTNDSMSFCVTYTKISTFAKEIKKSPQTIRNSICKKKKYVGCGVIARWVKLI